MKTTTTDEQINQTITDLTHRSNDARDKCMAAGDGDDYNTGFEHGKHIAYLAAIDVLRMNHAAK